MNSPTENKDKREKGEGVIPQLGFRVWSTVGDGIPLSALFYCMEIGEREKIYFNM